MLRYTARVLYKSDIFITVIYDNDNAYNFLSSYIKATARYYYFSDLYIGPYFVTKLTNYIRNTSAAKM